MELTDLRSYAVNPFSSPKINYNIKYPVGGEDIGYWQKQAKEHLGDLRM